MKNVALFIFVLGSMSITSCSSDDKEDQPVITLTQPKGWAIAGSSPTDYNMGIDEKGGKDGGKAATIVSIKDPINGFGTLMQMIPADSFAGKKVRMSGFMRSASVKDWAGFWMRVDLKDGTQGEFDNMHDRAIRGTTDWQKIDIVLHVNNTAGQLAYGALLSGSGQIWFDQLNMEIVADSTPITNTTASNKPNNMDFEQ